MQVKLTVYHDVNDILNIHHYVNDILDVLSGWDIDIQYMTVGLRYLFLDSEDILSRTIESIPISPGILTMN